MIWEQQLDGIAVFEAVLISHSTKHGELVSVSTQFVPDAVSAANGTAAALGKTDSGGGEALGAADHLTPIHRWAAGGGPT